jgi:phage-related minor tail protein
VAGIGDLVATLAIDNRDFIRGVKQAESLTASMSSKITGLLTPLAASFAGAFAVGSAISGAKEAAAAEAKLTAVLTATGHAAGISTEQVKAYAAQLQAVTNFEDDATVSAASMLAAFTNIKGDQFTATLTAAADLATVMGGDLGSAVKLLGKAMNDPADGLSKLAKAGVQFTDQQKQQIAALQESGDLMGAQEAILGALNAKFKGAAESVADPFIKLKNNVGDIGETLGAGMLPVLNSLAETTVSWLVPMNDLLGSGVNAMTKMTEVVIGAGVAFVALKVATIAYAAYQRLATISAITFQAVVNPALMLKVAAGIAIAAGTVLAMDAAMDKVAGAAPGAVAGIRGIADAADGIGAGVQKLEKVSDLSREIADQVRFIANNGDERGIKLDQMVDEAGGMHAPGVAAQVNQLESLWKMSDEVTAAQKRMKEAQDEAAKAQRDAADKVLEHKDRAAELNDELAVLTGAMTKQEAAARALERQGFTPEQADDLAGKQAQIDELKGKGKSASGQTQVAAVTAGSREALSIIAQASNASRNPLEKKADQQIKEQQKANVMLANLPEKIGKHITFEVATIT